MFKVKRYIEIQASELTLVELAQYILDLQKQHPDEEIYIDGDLHAVVGKAWF